MTGPHSATTEGPSSVGPDRGQTRASAILARARELGPPLPYAYAMDQGPGYRADCPSSTARLDCTAPPAPPHRPRMSFGWRGPELVCACGWSALVELVERDRVNRRRIGRAIRRRYRPHLAAAARGQVAYRSWLLGEMFSARMVRPGDLVGRVSVA